MTYVHIFYNPLLQKFRPNRPTILTILAGAHASLVLLFIIIIDMSSNLVQYVVVRGDLITALKWPLGAVIAQACHASVAVTHMFYEDKNTQNYLADLDNMHKVVLEAPSEDSLQKLSKALQEGDVHHKLWVEQPENFPTCIVVKPYPKEEVQKYFKKFKLFKGIQ